jgi:hypothetical protein
MMMQPPGNPKREDAALQQLWRHVCASRGTPAPDAARLDGFIEDLGAREREKLESVLLLAVRGREPPGELTLLSWAAACTRPALLGQLQIHGLGFTSATLFACGLALRQEGWDMQHRIAQLGVASENVHEHPLFAKSSIHDSVKVKNCTRTFGLSVQDDFPAGPDGICWSAPQSEYSTRGASFSAGFANHGLTYRAITS